MWSSRTVIAIPGVKLWSLAILLAQSTVVSLAAENPHHTGADYESDVLHAVDAIGQSDLEASLEKREGLVTKYPNSKLGFLMLGDLLAARAGSPELLNRYSDNLLQLEGLRDELSQRWRSIVGNTPAAEGKVPANLILSSPAEKYVLAADASHSRLYVYENTESGYQLVEDFFMTIGREGMGKFMEGDLRTPEGVYYVTSYLPGDSLPARYGPGAFPINYPNEYDRQQNRTGYGIWIHGTEPENYNRVPLASDGCLSLSNDAFNRIRRYISINGSTPVIISRSFQWVDPTLQPANDGPAKRVIEQWASDWESLDTDRYLEHYSEFEFAQYHEFAERKKQVNRYKKFIDVTLHNLSIYRYPADQDMLLVSFVQEYNSDNHRNVTHKRQYWKHTDGKWRIVHESRPGNMAHLSASASTN